MEQGHPIARLGLGSVRNLTDGAGQEVARYPVRPGPGDYYADRVYTYDAANRLTAVNGVPYTWDAAGHLLSDGTRAYTWDPAGRLTCVVSGTSAAQYTYHAAPGRQRRWRPRP